MPPLSHHQEVVVIDDDEKICEINAAQNEN
jgi:hypothetical protein